MSFTRAARTAVLVTLALATASCHRKAERPAPSAPGTTPAASQAGPAPTADELSPLIREMSSGERIADRVVVELARPVFRGFGADQPADPGTVLSLSPRVAGSLVVSGPSTLTFTPTDGFAPATKYVARLESVVVDGAAVKAPETGWEREFTTEAFRFVGAQVVDFDPKAKTATIELEWSGPVDAAQVRPKLSATLDVDGKDLPVAALAVSSAPDAHVVAVKLRHPQLKTGREVELAMKAGVPLLARARSLAPAAKATALMDEWRSSPRMTIKAVSAGEGTSGVYLEVVCDDDAAGGRRSYWDPVGHDYYQDLSRTCEVSDESARELIRLDPPLDFSVASGAAGFRIFADFKRGSHDVHVARGLRTVAGGVLRADFDASVSIPARTPRVAFVSKGRYVPRSAWRSLPVQHLNVDRATLTVRHVPPENLVFWLASDTEDASDRDSNLLTETTFELSAPQDVLGTRSLDVTSVVPAGTKGLVEIEIAAGNVSDAVRLVLTDLAVVAKATGGDLGKPWGQRVHAWVMDVATLKPVRGAEVKLVRKSGQVVTWGLTKDDGAANLELPAASVDPAPPVALLVTRGSDVTYLAFEEVETEVEEARVAGEPYSGVQEHRATIYSDRGVYRPGETAHVVAIVRGKDFAAPPAGMPVTMRVVSPTTQVLRESQLQVDDTGLVAMDVTFAQFATTGRHEVQLDVAAQRVGSLQFHVEEFVPERMEVKVTPAAPQVLAGTSPAVDVAARYLFGGVPAGNKVELTCTLEAGRFEPAQNANFEYGTWGTDGKPPGPRALGVVTGALDEEGETSLTCPPATALLEGPGRVVASAAVFEAGSGRTTVAQAAVPLHPESYYIGLSSRTKAAKAGEALLLDGVVVDWTGQPQESVHEVALELFRLEPEYGWWFDEGTGRTSHRREWRRLREGSERVKVTGGKFTASFMPTGYAPAYLVRAAAGSARTELRVAGGGSSYWWDEEGDYEGMARGQDQTPRPSRATWLALDVPKSAKVGEEVPVRFTAPWRGRVLFTAETDRVLASQWRDVEAGPVTWSFTPKALQPNVYVTALLLKPPHLDSPESFAPERAYGVASVPIEPTELRHEVKLVVPKEVRSSAPLVVKLDVGPLDGPARATIAAVDEGILSLTRFQSPDPLSGVFTHRGLGVDTFETFGWTLLVPPEARSPGGDEALTLGRIQVVRPVALWSGVLDVPKSGKLEVTLDVPQYRGALRVMAVVVGRKKAGSAEARVVVRDPLTLDVTLPRFLVQEDDADVPVFVTNVSGSARSVEVSLTSEVLDAGGRAPAGGASPVVVVGKPRTIELADGQGDVVVFRVRAKAAAGASTLTAVATSKELRSSHEAAVPILPAGPKSRVVQRIELEEGTTALTSQLSGWLPLSERSTFWVTSNPHAAAFDQLDFLVRYPYGCIEQTASTTRPLVFLPHLLPAPDPKVVAAGGIEALARAGLDRILSMQLPSGAFSYWPGGGEAAYWSTANATHLLIDAKARNYPIAQDRIDQALAWMEDRITNHYEKGRDHEDWYSKDAEPYMHYVLALAGRPRKARAEALVEKVRPTATTDPESAEHLFMLQAALYLAGDRKYERELRRPDVSAVREERKNSWTFFSDRRRRGFMLSTYVDLFGREGSDALANLVAEALLDPRRRYTTQDVVWSVTGLGKVVEQAADFEPPTLRVDGNAVTPAPARPGQVGSERTFVVPRASEYGDVTLELPDKGEGHVFVIVASEGVREGATWATGGEGLQLARSYVAADGSPVDVEGGVALGDLVHVVIELTNTTSERIANVALVDRIPAGWEIENPRLGRGTATDWLDASKLWDADHLDVRDDRLEVFGHLESGEAKKVVYAVRAVTAGRFTIPPVEAEAMYDPSRWARQPGGSAGVAPPWPPAAQ